MKVSACGVASACFVLLVGCAPGDDAAEQAPESLTAKFDSEHFLAFFNKEPSLTEGNYTLVAGTSSPSQAGPYTLTVTHDDGRIETFNGQWMSSAGPAPGSGNPEHAFTLSRPGGVKAVLRSDTVDTYLLLVRDGTVITEDDDGGGGMSGTDSLLDLPKSRINDPSYAQAYYATIDPNSDRDSLQKWKTINGFDAGDTTHVIFRDTKDLGYGRDMHFRDQGGGALAFYVNNYLVDRVPGQQYGALNVNAAIAQDSKYHIGTNAIEYGPIDVDGVVGNDDVNFDGVVNQLDFFPRFYNFSSTPPYERRLTVNLDKKGEKAMPGPCIVCHGGRADALTPNPVNPGNIASRFWRNGDTLAHLQPLDVGSFEYYGQSPWTRAEMEPGLKIINKAIYDSYLPNATPAYGYAEWNSGMARKMLEAWYGGVDLPGSFSDSYVPDDWNPAVNNLVPAGADTFYRDVMATNCRTCHLLRGIDAQSEIDFTSYAKFISYADRVEELVFDRGLMPLAALTFTNFHQTTALAEQLATFLEDNASFSHRAGDGSLLLPGRPIARAGPDRTSPSPVSVSGVASLFAKSYQWSITSNPIGAIASLTGPATVRPTLNANLDGIYVLSLTVSDGVDISEPDEVTVTIDSGAVNPRSLTFADVKNIIQTTPGDCVGCHYPGAGPPIFYTDPSNPNATSGPDNRTVFATIRSRANLADPVFSRLLLKPSGDHHGGGVLTGFDLAGDRSNYDLFLNWILEGAREN